MTFKFLHDVLFQGKYVYLRDLAGLAVRNIENDMKTECEKPITQEIYHSFTEFKRKSRHAVLNALEDELHVCRFILLHIFRKCNTVILLVTFSKIISR